MIQHRTNQYSGKCYRCGELVGAGEGLTHGLTDEERKAWHPAFQFMRNIFLTQHGHCHDHHGDEDFTHFQHQPQR